MPEVQFDESQFKLRSRRILGEPEIPGMIKFLVVKGIVKTEKQAVGIMLGVVVTLILISVFVAKAGGVKPATLDPEYLTMHVN